MKQKKSGDFYASSRAGKAIISKEEKSDDFYASMKQKKSDDFYASSCGLGLPEC